MPMFSFDDLTALAGSILLAVGTPEKIADCVADHLATSNLRGVDSHGVMRLPWYVDQIRDGLIVPDAEPELQKETTTTAIGIVRLKSSARISPSLSQLRRPRLSGLSQTYLVFAS